jgi:hypothetical protein
MLVGPEGFELEPLTLSLIAKGKEALLNTV